MKQFLDIDEYLAEHLLWQGEALAAKIAKGVAALAIIASIWINQQLDRLEPQRAQRPIAATI